MSHLRRDVNEYGKNESAPGRGYGWHEGQQPTVSEYARQIGRLVFACPYWFEVETPIGRVLLPGPAVSGWHEHCGRIVRETRAACGDSAPDCV